MLRVLLACCAVALVTASINNNPDTWELPPAAPNYAYWNQGVIGSGPLATLVTIRDPATSDVSYNTSLFAFSVSGGLVPLNYIDLEQGHCHSNLIADVLVCDFESSAGGVTQFYQLTVTPGEGGANRLAVVDQLTAPFEGYFALNNDPLVTPSGTLLMIQLSPSQAPGSTGYVFNVWELIRADNTTGSQLALDAIGSWPATGTAGSIGDGIGSFALNADGTRLAVTTWFTRGGSFTLVLSYPELELLSNTSAPNSYLLGASSASGAGAQTGLSITPSTNSLVYATIALDGFSATGAESTDSLSSAFSSGIFVASAGGTFVSTTGPCVYVAAYANAQSKSQYAIVSQVTYPTAAAQAAAIEAQIPVAAYPGNTVVANDKYLFLIIDEIMFRYPATC